MRVEVGEAVGELASAGEAVEVEAVGAHVPAGRGLVDHVEQGFVGAESGRGEELVAVHVVRAGDSGGEERGEDNAVVAVGEGIAECFGAASCSVDGDHQGDGWAVGGVVAGGRRRLWGR
ncbi:hypothetical protein [Streptomyces sp. NPDC050416]|uniref:hypothetical protein n=1 Tax=Streptomyces sp. NPDC050416 TaxID=3365611 RepID=UPI00378BB517